MFRRLFHFSLAAAVMAPAAAFSTPTDRHPGVYEFPRLPAGFCERTERQNGPAPQAQPRLSRLGDLPAAYVIRVDAPAALAPSAAATTAPAVGQSVYDPCARVGPALMRVK